MKLVIALIFALGSAASAECISQTIFGSDGRITFCTTCCSYGNCTTTCF